MLQWTGERFLPWVKEAAVAYEHLHRYLWVSRFTKNKRVLDLASGEGYGAALLAENAEFVCGVDIDETVIHHASEKYRRPNLKFLQGTVTQVPIHDAQSFDAIVCFEAIEHIAGHDQLMDEVVRLLKPSGQFFVSTPNKEVYRSAQEQNPFHVKELSLEEFEDLLRRYFAEVRYLGQSVHPACSIWPLNPSRDACIQGFDIAWAGDEFQALRPDQRAATYFIATATNAESPPLEGSVLVDHSDELLKGYLVKLDQRDEALAWRASQVEQLEDDKRQLLLRCESAEQQLNLRQQELVSIYQSRAWKSVVKLRSIRDRIFRLLGRGPAS